MSTRCNRVCLEPSVLITLAIAIFIDEACQYLAHLLKSKTCKSHRGAILEVLEYLVYNTKLVVLADAHLDDLTIEFFMNLRPAGEKPYIKNEYCSGGRQVYWYEGKQQCNRCRVPRSVDAG
ncbi:MAG: hypothetical protein V7K89_23590 [Nostoc sp.]